MGRTLYAWRRLLPPFEAMEERYMTIPAGQKLSVGPHPASFRVVYFLADPVLAAFADGSRKEIRAGDAISVSESGLFHYRSANPRRDATNHVLVIRFSAIAQEALSGKVPRHCSRSEAELYTLIARKLGGFRHFPQILRRSGTEEILLQLQREREKRNASSRWKVSGLCLALISELLDDRTAPELPGPTDRGQATVGHVRHFIRERCQENLTLARIAWEVRLSGEHLSRLFRKYEGMTVFDYLDQVRVEKAKQLLATSELPVVRIASLCGYSSANLLCRHFKGRTGTTPLSYRLQARGGEAFSPSQLE